MKIQSRIKPEDGKVRNITVFGETYAFTLDAQGRCVAEVFDEDAIECLLSHDDLYREVPTRASRVMDVAEDEEAVPRRATKKRAPETAKDEPEAPQEPVADVPAAEPVASTLEGQ